MPTLSAVLQAFLGLVFLSAGVAKAVHWETLPAVVRAYGLLPPALVTVTARSLPAVEVLIGGALLTRTATPWAGLAAGGMLLLFAGAMSLALRSGRRDIDCGCFQGGLRQTLDVRLVVRNVLLAGAAVFCAATPAASGDGAILVLLAAGSLFVAMYGLSSVWALEASRDRMLERMPR